jgi:hypothetical protein
MRIFGLEISVVPAPSRKVWYREHNHPKNLDKMTFKEMRNELLWAINQMEQGKVLVVSKNNPARKINAL